MNKTFTYYHDVTLGDTDLFTNMYFTNYFKLQGVVRELFVKECILDYQSIFRGDFYLVTKTATCDYFKPFSLYDRIKITLQCFEIKVASVKLVFKFFNDDTGDLYAEGSQQIVFFDAQRKITKIPETIRNTCLDYQDRRQSTPTRIYAPRKGVLLIRTPKHQRKKSD